MVREQLTVARIDRVEFGPAAVKVTVTTGHPDGDLMRVEFVSDAETANRRLMFRQVHGTTEVAEFALSGGVPTEWWVVVSRGHEWIDYRRVTPYTVPPVDVDVLPGAADPDDEVRRLILGGESGTLEFKRQAPTDRDGNVRLARVVAAFANGDGGVILFGVDRDEATVVGIAEEFPVVRDRLTDIVTGNVTPRPHIDVDAYNTHDGLVVALAVGPGDRTPYAVDRTRPRYYIRRNATTLEASQDEIRALARSRPPTNEPALPWQ